MYQRSNPARYLPNIESRLGNPGNYNNPTRKTNFKRLSNYIRRTQKKSASGTIVAKRLGIAQGLKTQLKDLMVPTIISQKTTYEVESIAGDGECFYRSLYRAVRNHPNPTVFPRFLDALKIDYTNGVRSEKKWIKKIRKALGSYIRKGTQDNGSNLMYNDLTADKTLLSAIFNVASNRKQKVLKKLKKGELTKIEFYNKIAKIIEGGYGIEWADQFDTMKIAQLLEHNNIKLITEQIIKPESPTKNVDGQMLDFIYLKYNGHNHYEYWKYNTDS